MVQSITAVSQFITRNHGQGKINLELLVRLLERGYGIRAVCSWLDDEVANDSRAIWDRILVSHRLPTNWLRCEAFRYQAERRLSQNRQVDINNVAAAIRPSIVNIAMFVHSAWRYSQWRPAAWKGPNSALQSAFTLHQSQLEKRAFGMTRWVVALSDQVKNEVIEYCGVDEAKVLVIPPGVDSQLFRPLEPATQNPLRSACKISEHDDRQLAIFVGEIRSVRKNLDLVFKLMTFKPDLLLAVLGSTSGSPYPGMASKLKVADRVFFLGQRNDVPHLMSGADVFVFPTHYEPFGLVVTEAMACAVPVIVTQQAGSACVVEHQREGWLLKDGADIEGLESAIDQVRDPAIRAAAASAARKRSEGLTWDRMADQYEALLKQ